MLAELFDKFRHQAEQYLEPRCKELPGDPRTIMLTSGTEYKLHAVPAALRDHTVYAFDSLIDFCKREDLNEPELFYDEKVIMVLMDGKMRDEFCKMDLLRSEAFTRLEALAVNDGESFAAREVVRLLRFDLPGLTDSSLIKKLSKIDFSRRSDGAQAVEHGRESMGRSVEKKVQQADDIPETFTVKVCPFSNFGLSTVRVDITIGLYLDMEKEEIYLKPLADEIALGLERAVSHIGQRIKQSLGNDHAFGNRIYQGTV